MAVETTTAFSGPYTANGATTTFGFTFIAKAADEIGVLLRDSDGVDSVVSNSAYTVTLNANGTGSVVFTTAPATGNSVYIYSDVSFQQSIDFEDGTGWKAAPVNEVSDRAALRDIYLKNKADRSLVVPYGETGFTLPTAAERQGLYLAFDADGDAVASSGTGADSGLRVDLAADSGSSLSGFLQAGTGAVARTAQSKMRERVSVLDFIPTNLHAGIRDRTGTTDLSTYIQAAIDYWKTSQPKNFVDYPADLIFPPGDYSIASTLSLDPVLNTVGGLIYGDQARIILTSGTVAMRLNTGANSKLWRDLTIRGLKFVDGTLKLQSVNGAGVNVYGFVLDGLEFEGDIASHNLWFEGCFEGTVSNCRVNRTQDVVTTYSCIFVDNSGFGFQSSVVWIGNTTRGGKNGFRQTGYSGDLFMYGNTHLVAEQEGAYIECNNAVIFGGHYEENCRDGTTNAGLNVVGGGVISGITSACGAPANQQYGAKVYVASGAGFDLGPGADYSTVAGHKLYYVDGLGTLPISVWGTYDASGGMTSSGRITGPSSSGGYQVSGTKVVGAQGAAIANITTTATAGSLPTPDGSVTIANAATPTVNELLEYCVELESKLETLLSRVRDHGLIAT